MILVTGGTGLVGSHLLYKLVSNNENVRAIYRREKTLKRVEHVFSYFSDEPETLFKINEKKAIKPSDKEISENIPSRSAKLRYVIKKTDFYDFKTDIQDQFSNLIEIENFGNKL